MVEATNFVEKTLGKSLDPEKTPETPAEIQKEIPIYTPPPPPVPQYIQPQPTVQIIEKIVYKKQRIHGFFRTLTIIALLAIGFLMLWESTGIIELSVNAFKLHQIYPIIIILSSIIIRSYKWFLGKIFGLLLFLGVFCWIFTLGIYTSLYTTTKQKSNITYTYTVPKSTTKKTQIHIEKLAGNTYIEGNTNKENIERDRNSDKNLISQSGEKNSIGYIKISEDKNRNILQNNISTANITLPKKQKINLLYIKSLIWIHTIDMKTYQRDMLKFHWAINDLTIKVGNIASGNKIEIQGAAANIDMEIPNDVGVTLYYKHYIGKLALENFKAETEKNRFISNNFAQTKKRLDIYINLWIGNTKINRKK